MISTRPIFVGGLLKSGTTLLRVMLANHPQIFGGLETHWFTDAFSTEWRDPCSGSVARLLGFFDVSADEHAALVGRSENALDYFDRFMSHCARRAGKPRWTEKTPGNIVHLDLIWRTWSDSYVIHVVRDPRDVYASWKRNDKYDLGVFLSDARAIVSALGDQLGHSDSRYLEIHYEDLVEQPREVMTSVVAFAGEEWSEGLDRHAGGGGEFERVIEVTGKRSATLESVARPLFADSIGQWRTILAPDEVTAIETELADYGGRSEAFRA